MNREFVRNYFPDFLEKYDSYPHNIQRADAIRYLLLKKYGGLYVDMDFECLENLETLLEGADFIAGKEPETHSARFGIDYIICNAFMASTPNNGFINFLCDKLFNYPTVSVNNGVDILESTGPFLLTRAYHAYPDRDLIRILEAETIYPLELWDAAKIMRNEVTKEMKERIDKAYAVHYFFGTW